MAFFKLVINTIYTEEGIVEIENKEELEKIIAKNEVPEFWAIRKNEITSVVAETIVELEEA